jgi:plasmid stabilization system protein ParE
VAQVAWSAEAERWPLRIHDYIARDSPHNAFTVVEAIYERAQILEQFPLMGHSYRSLSGRDLRILL